MEAWKQFLEHQEEEFGRETVQKWLYSLKIVRFDACNLYLEAFDSFQANWFEEHIRPKVVATFVNNNKKRIKVHLSIARKETKTGETGALPNAVKNPAKEAPQRPKCDLIFDALDLHCAFENYIEFDDNALPLKLLKSLEAKDFPTFNPIYLYGRSGSGKTHLLMATVQLLQKQGARVLYARAETFTEHVVSAIRAGEMSSFRQAYRNVDVLVIDDVQIFARKAATQEEFFHTFNTLHLAGKQIILAANCAPQELSNVEPRLISRFEWGIVLPLHLLPAEQLETMMEMKSKAMGCMFSQKVIAFLLETFSSSTKSITRALQALVLRSHLNEQGILSGQLTVPQARSLLHDLILEEQKTEITAPKIVQHVCEYFGILADDLKGKVQSRERVLPRQIGMYLCRNELKMPYLKIGELFSKDHSTVMSGVRNIKTALDEGKRDVIDPLEDIRKRLREPTL